MFNFTSLAFCSLHKKTGRKVRKQNTKETENMQEQDSLDC